MNNTLQNLIKHGLKRIVFMNVFRVFTRVNFNYLLVVLLITITCMNSFVVATEHANIDDLLSDYEKAYTEKNENLYRSLCSVNFTSLNKQFNRNMVQIKSGSITRMFIFNRDIERSSIFQNRASIRYIPVKIKEQSSENSISRYRRLDLVKYGNFWKIEDDRYDTPPREEIELKAINITNAKIDSKIDFDAAAKILMIIEAWRVAWENEDLDDYLSFYADDAQIVRVTVAQGKEFRKYLSKSTLKEGMERLNKRYRWIDVKISDLELTPQSEIAILAKFLQYFSAGVLLDQVTYNDLGFKRLIFKKYGNEWKIAYEDWRMYEKIPSYEIEKK